ncbi:nitrogen regulation protein NR(II) [Rubellimicrobium sp. CFH 75288]|uniref:two-component system sensor histidine kinase NtrB n=1 Tax=Rubellimicrobium sp. CFH 75288 TaxID=2697034 RepID=UPI001412EF71|nr:ATP-binding protein [Rubellimicrobium sp. CFH 75288]NAZ36899.1 PAS domain-containing protein [Rubellimicrobium sp. CFH 75288]
MIPSCSALWASLPLPALILDAHDRIEEANPAAEAFLNASARALAGLPVWDRVMIAAPIEDAYRRARTQRTPLLVSDVDVGTGERPPLLCSVHLAPLEDDRMLLLLSPREIASRVTQHDRSAKAARSAIGMAEMLAHEIKNPLAGITGAAQLLSMSLRGPDLELTELIVEETRRIVTLLSRVEQFGNLSPPIQGPVNIHDVLDRARQSAAVGFAAHMRFVEDYDPSLPAALADPDQLLQVMLNLLRNAAEAAPGGGTIRLRTFYEPSLRLTRPDGTKARLPLQVEVIDDGPGVPPDIAAEIFEPFVSGRENGTGLGLALVAKLLAGMGAWISVDSVPGRTVFRLSLPRAPEPDSPKEGEE